MSKRPQTAPSVPKTESLPPEAEITKAEPLFLDDHLASARSNTHAEIVLREAVEREFKRVHEMLREFVQGELDKGYSIEEILKLYELVTCLVPTVTWNDGRPRVEMTAEIVERTAEG